MVTNPRTGLIIGSAALLAVVGLATLTHRNQSVSQPAALASWNATSGSTAYPNNSPYPNGNSYVNGNRYGNNASYAAPAPVTADGYGSSTSGGYAERTADAEPYAYDTNEPYPAGAYVRGSSSGPSPYGSSFTSRNYTSERTVVTEAPPPPPPVVYGAQPYGSSEMVPQGHRVYYRHRYYTRSYAPRHRVYVKRRPFGHSVAIVAGSAAGGALIGGLAGGGTGAGIGALAGGGAGLVYDRLTHKKRVVE